MGTTIKQTILQTTISESISINGVSYGNTISKSFEGNGKVDQRMMEVDSSRLTSVWEYKAALPDQAGQGVKSEFTYFRITNTDNSVGVTIQLFVSSSKSGFFHLPAGCSLLLMGNDMDFLCEGESFTLADLVKVQAKSDLSEGSELTNTYLEYIAVFKGGTGDSVEG